MRVFLVLMVPALLLTFGLDVPGQEKESAEAEFTRSLGQTPSVTTSNPTTVRRVTNRRPAVKKKKTAPRGMKMSFEMKEKCNGEFVAVSSNSVFRSGDCIRVKFRLNFKGYLTIINLGTSGTNAIIFSANQKAAGLLSNTDYFVPDALGWEFDENPGNEQFIFLLSNRPLSPTAICSYLAERNQASVNSPDFESQSRDLRRREENNSIYFFSDAFRKQDPVVFRMTIKHR